LTRDTTATRRVSSPVSQDLVLFMSNRRLFRQRVRAAAFLRHFINRADGVAAVEFALILPFMAFLFMGAVEMSQAVTVNRRVTQVGSTAGDLVARFNTNITSTDIQNIMTVSSLLLNPYPKTRLKIDVSVVSSSSSSAADTKTKWFCSFDSSVSATNVTCTCPNTAFTLPATGMVTTADSVVVADISYGYKPNLVDVFMKSSFSGPKSGGVYTMTETVYLKPRAVCPTIKKSDGTTCGC
jgi:Flp pilus assembly protein TadG